MRPGIKIHNLKFRKSSDYMDLCNSWISTGNPSKPPRTELPIDVHFINSCLTDQTMLEYLKVHVRQGGI